MDTFLFHHDGITYLVTISHGTPHVLLRARMIV